jgi:hypothetical protein
MSWGAGEFSSETSYDSFFTTPSGHSGVTFVASSGDNGAPASWPSISTNVLSVGGTTLSLGAGGNYGGEHGWSGSGGGYSSYIGEPNYQRGLQNTGRRSNPDVAYDADPYSGFYVRENNSWYSVGGTSAGAPQWAAVIAIANQGRAANGRAALSTALQAVYSLSAGDFHDVTTGFNRFYAGAGYDLVTGRGSPIANLVVRDLAAYGSTPTTTAAAHPAAAAVVGGSTSGGRMQKADETVLPAQFVAPSVGSARSSSTGYDRSATPRSPSYGKTSAFATISSLGTSRFNLDSSAESESTRALDSVFDLDGDQLAALTWASALDEGLTDRQDPATIE